ncbi:amino acid transporter [Xylariaceae sp. FL0255]|nr:amino acid transporter [Xylariaceae sp. FL0255]
MAAAFDHESLAATASKAAAAEEPELDYTSSIDDESILRRLGRKPQLSRSFGFVSTLGLALTTLVSWEGALVSSVPVLLNGGAAGVVYGFIANWIGMTSVYLVLGEMASIAPTAGGQYHWVAILAPPSCSNFLSYLTAWLTTAAWQSIAVYAGYGVATMLQGVISLTQPSYSPQTWHTVLILWGAQIFAALMNTTSSRVLAKFESFVLILQLLGFFGVLIPMVYLSGHNRAEAVFLNFSNTGGWSSQALSFFVGFPNLASTVIGADCSVHMSEEIQFAAIVVPRALITSVLVNGLLALAILIGMLFCLTDLSEALEASETLVYPFISVFYSATKSVAGAAIMVVIVLVLGFVSGVGAYASASRLIWSFSRDRGLPLSKQFVKLNDRMLPTTAVFVTLIMSVLLSLVSFASTTALDALLSLVVAGIHSSYLLTCALLLWRRTTGFFKRYVPGVEPEPGVPTWGPWKVPEPLGTMNNIFACIYSILLLFWSFWPQYTPTPPATANWSILVFGGVVLTSITWWLVKAKHYFKGPIRDYE